MMTTTRISPGRPGRKIVGQQASAVPKHRVRGARAHFQATPLGPLGPAPVAWGGDWSVNRSPAFFPPGDRALLSCDNDFISCDSEFMGMPLADSGRAEGMAMKQNRVNEHANTSGTARSLAWGAIMIAAAVTAIYLGSQSAWAPEWLVDWLMPRVPRERE